MDEPHSHDDILPRDLLIQELIQEFVEQKDQPMLELKQVCTEILIRDPFTREQLQAFVEKRNQQLLEVPQVYAELLKHDPFAQEQLQAIADGFEKNGFELTAELDVDLQCAAEIFFRQRSEYQKTLRLSEERKNCEAFRDLYADLTKQFRNLDDPSSRSQFVERIVAHFWQPGQDEDVEEDLWDLYTELTKRIVNLDDVSSIMRFLSRRRDDNWQDDENLDFESLKLALIYLSVARRFYDMLNHAEQLAQALHGLFTDVLRSLPEDKRGRRKDWPLHTFILGLKAIWEKGTAKKAGRSRNPRTREIEGPFVRFVTICLTYLEPHKPYPSLGETIHKVLQAETVTRNGKNSPKK